MNFPFARFFQKSSVVQRALYLLTGGVPIWTRSSYENLVREGYEKNVTVYNCVNEIARSVAGIGWKLYSTRSGERIEISTHPLLKLIQRPNPSQGRAKFFEALMSYLLISGDSYIEKVGPDRAGAAPIELYTLRPDRVRVIPDPVLRVSGYEHRAGGQIQIIPAENMIHLKLFSAWDDFYGFSPLTVASRAVDVDVEGQSWIKSLLQNAAAQSGALIVPVGSSLSPTQKEDLKKALDERRIGGEKAGRPMLLEGGMDWKNISWSPEQAGLIDIRKMSKIEIAQAYQIPPELIGDSEHKTYQNYQEARRAFYVETVIPTAEAVRDELNHSLVPAFGDNLELDINRDAIDVVQEARMALFDRANTAAFMTINEKRAMTQTGDDIEGGDVILVPVSMMPLGAVDMGLPNDPAPQIDPMKANGKRRMTHAS